MLVCVPSLSLAGARSARAALHWTVDASIVAPETGTRRTVANRRIGDLLILDVTLRNRSRSTIQGVSASVYGYDPTALRLVPEAAILSNGPLAFLPTAPGEGLGGLVRLPRRPLSEIPGVTNQTRFFEGRQLSGTTESGERDISPLTGIPGGPHFRIVFQVVGLAETAVSVGANAPFDIVILLGGGRGRSVDARLLLPVPAPSTATLMALGLAGLARTKIRQPPGRARPA